MRNLLLLLCGTLLLDQASKALASLLMQRGESIKVISDAVRLTLVHNSGAAFGLLSGNRVPFVLTTLFAVAALVFLLTQLRKRRTDVSLPLVLVLGGALGNLIDRVRFGEVVDFIDLGWKNVRWPVFNVADIAVTLGVALFCYRTIFQKRPSDRSAAA
ncbi:MAG: signal peptidase II [Candidatus Eiseniibacteriota bacterium]|nr:MAG: signal peptidase II [Candidatus Eisenbacteria bacterium]